MPFHSPSPTRTRKSLSKGRGSQTAKRRCRLEHLENRFLLAARILGIDADTAPLYAPGEVLIGFEQGAGGYTQVARTLNQTKPGGWHPVDFSDSVYDEFPFAHLELSSTSDILTTARQLSGLPGVAFAEPNYLVSVEAFPDPTANPSFGSLWGLHNTGQSGGTVDADIDALEVWDVQYGSPASVVGIIDTGIDYRHPDLYQNIWINQGEIPVSIRNNLIDVDGDGLFTFWDLNDSQNWDPSDPSSPVSDLNSNGYIDGGDLLNNASGWEDGINNDSATGNIYTDDLIGWDFVNNDNDPWDDADHGTHVAGTIGAVNNTTGVVGVNWQVQMAALKFLDWRGSGYTSDAIEAIQYANTVGVDLTNNSWGGGGFSQGLYDAIAASSLFVAAAGNDGLNTDIIAHYPSSYSLPNIISVAATDRNDAYAGFSNYGATSVDLAAPGVAILSTTPGGTYSVFEGTSMATPHVAGAAALLLAEQPTLSTEFLKEALLNTVDPLTTTGKSLTDGRLNVFSAVSYLEDDPNAPAAVNDLAATGSGLTTVELSWTATDDDGAGLKPATAYDVRYSTSPINDANWAAASQAIGEPKPAAPDSAENFVVTGLDPNTTYYFALRVRDNVGNESAISSPEVSATTNAGEQVFFDDMEGGIGTWAFTGLWHQSSRRWTSSNTSWYYGQESTGTYNTGTTNSGVLTTSINLEDYAEALLGFSEWSQLEADPDYDRTQVQISSDGGPFTTVFESHGTGNAWPSRTVDLTPYAGGIIDIQFSFDTGDPWENDHEGWYIDDVTIIAQPSGPTINVSPVAGLETSEDGDTVAFEVSLSDPPAVGTDVTIGISSSDPSEGDVDKTSLVFTDTNWETPQIVTVTGLDDPVSEGEVVIDGDIAYTIVTASAVSADPAYAGIDPADVSVTNLDKDMELWIDDVSLLEGDSGITHFVFTVRLSQASSTDVTVDYATEDGTATTADSDYVATSGTLIIPADETSGQITVAVNGDKIIEVDQTFTVNLTDPSANVVIVDETGIGTIVDDDNPRLSIDDVTVIEGNSGTKTATFTVSLLKSHTSDITFNYATAPGTTNPATAGVDYESTSGSLTFNSSSSETVKTFDVTIYGDTFDEESETFFVNLSNFIPADITIVKGQGIGTIGNDDGPPIRIIDNGESGFTTNGVFSYWDNQGYAGADGATDVHQDEGSGLDIASWTFTGLTPGQLYQVSTTWTVTWINRAFDAPYKFKVGGQEVRTERVSQRSDPQGDVVVSGTNFQHLGDPVLIDSSGTLVVELSDDIDPKIDPTDPTNDLHVIADAVRIEAVGPEVTITETGGSTDVSEGGATDSYEIALDSVPTNPVDITVTADSQSLVSLDNVTFSGSVILSNLTDQTAQSIYVKAYDDSLFEGNHTSTITHAASSADPGYDGISIDSVVANITDNDAPEPTFQIEHGVVTVGASGTTVNLDNTYVSPIVITTPNYDAGGAPAVARLDNVMPNSFDVQLVNPTPAGGSVAGNLHYIVVEEGAFTVDGVNVEAAKYTSTITDENNSWVGEARTYANSYSSPVVLGQVMTSNDPDWSVFWSRGGSQSEPPGGSLYVGKHVGEDPTVLRNSETVGYLVIESGSGTINGIEFEAGLGADIVQGMDNNPPYAYTLNNISSPDTAIVTQSAMDGGHGSWALLYGATPIGASSIQVAVDEDQLGDNERAHTTEQLAYLALKDSAGPPPTLSIGNGVATEGDGVVFDFTLSNASSGEIVLDLVASSGTATGGIDFETIGFQYSTDGGATWIAAANDTEVTFPAGQTSIVVKVDSLQDTIDEPSETFTLAVSGVVSGTVGDTTDTGLGTINDDDPAPSVTIADAAATTEGSPLVFDVTLSNASSADIVLALAATDGSATGGSDFETTGFRYSTDGGATWIDAATGTHVNFAAGQTAIKVEVDSLDDAIEEPTQTFTLDVDSVVSGVVGDTSDNGVGTIIDDDAPGLLIGNATATEGSGVMFDVTLSNAASGDIILDLVASSGTATGGVDFETTDFRYSTDGGTTWIAAANGTEVTFPAGQTAIIVEVDSLQDTIDEASENFTLEVSRVVRGTVGDITDTGNGTINDDDAAPLVTIADATSATEGTPLVFDVTLSNASSGDIVLDLVASSGTATSGVDFETTDFRYSTDSGTNWVPAANGTEVTFPAGQTSIIVEVESLQDTIDEASETFTLAVSSVISGAVGDTGDDGTGTINDDDDAPSVTIADAAAATEGSPLVFDVTLSNASSGDIILALAATDGSATGGVDFETTDFLYSIDGGATWIDAASGTHVTFAAGQTAIKVEVESLDDAIDESNETFALAVDSVVSGIIGDSTDTGIGTINDDDTAGVTISKTDVYVSEQGETSEIYTVVLTSQPVGGNVTVAITHDANQVTVSPTQLTFTPSDWASSQPVTVTAVDDTDIESFLHTSTIAHAASGADYDGVSIADVTANISDNDAPPGPPVQIVDDGDPGFTTSGVLSYWDNQGFAGDDFVTDVHQAKHNDATTGDKATWTFTGLTPGRTYQVSATWTFTWNNRATNAPYNIIVDEGETLVRIDQNRYPDPHVVAMGTNFEHLAEVTVGANGTLVVELSDDANGYVIADAVRVEAVPIVDGPHLEVGVVGDAGGWQQWQTVTLPHTYASMVVVATVDYGSNNIPMVARVQNASDDSFEVRVERPDGGTVPDGVNVHYLVVEEGVYTVAQDGINMEAMRIQSTITDRKGSWVGQSRSYYNAYSSPVVVGQVMTANDADWSVFWARGSSKGAIPSASTLYVGKHVAEDPDTTRAGEEIGYVVMEANPGTVGTVGSYNYQAAVGSDSIQGPDNNATGYSYSLSGLTSPTTAIVSAAAMDGGDGGWPVLYGDNALTATTLNLVFDEDQLSNAERSHTTEQVAYLIFEPSNSGSKSAVDAVMAAAAMRDRDAARRVDEALLELLFSGKLF